jgi:acyl dehydratase
MLLARRTALAAPGAAVDARAEASAVVAPARALAAYRRVCGFGPPGAALPITYPHALASPLHLALVAGRGFPVRPLGLVHVRNTIRALRPIPARAALDLVCTLRGPRETGRGQEFDLDTEVRVDGAAAWTETAVVLARRAGRAARPPAPATPPPGRPVARWELPAGLGRRYAAASGDWNPIHLSAATARVFGFRRAIAHGMWSLARVAAELRLGEEDVLLDVAFKLPVLLPAAVTLLAARDGATTGFALADADGVRPHLVGTAGPLGRGA